MNKFRTVISVIIMVLAGIVGFFAGATLGSGLEGAILFSMVLYSFLFRQSVSIQILP